MALHPSDYKGTSEHETASTQMTVVPDTMGTELVRPPRYPVAIGLSALFGLLVSAWAGLSIFIGPSFGFRPDGSTGLDWDLARGVLSVAPAVAGVVGCLMILGLSGHWQVKNGRRGLRLGALLVATSGIWLAIGFLAWRPLEGRSYLATPDALHGFETAVGVAIGPGLLLVAVALAVLGFLLGSAAAYRLDDELMASASPFRPSPTLVEVVPAASPTVPAVATED